MPEMPVSIFVRKVRKVFGRTSVLDGVTLEFSPGLMHGVIGPEGSGKTTLLRILLGLLKPTEGRSSFTAAANASISKSSVQRRLHAADQSLYAGPFHRRALDFFKELYGIPADLYEAKT